MGIFFLGCGEHLGKQHLEKQLVFGSPEYMFCVVVKVMDVVTLMSYPKINVDARECNFKVGLFIVVVGMSFNGSHATANSKCHCLCWELPLMVTQDHAGILGLHNTFFA